MKKNTKKAPIHYVDNVKLLEELKKYKDQLNLGKIPKLSDYIGLCIMKISENLATMPRFNGYSFKDQMISDGIENCVRYIYNFDPDKYNNPHAYLTKIIYYAFLRRIAFEKRELYVKYKTVANYGIYNDVTNPEGGKNVEVYDNLAEFIETFEGKKKEKDSKKPKKVKGIDQYVEEDIMVEPFDH